MVVEGDSAKEDEDGSVRKIDEGFLLNNFDKRKVT